MIRQALNDDRTPEGVLDVLVGQDHKEGRALLMVEASWSGGGAEFTAALTDPRGNTLPLSGEGGSMELAIEDPLLWWPRGYGEQPLYTLRVEAELDGRVLGVWERRIGLRTAGMSVERDGYGESFAHEINGVKVFAMGASVAPGPGLDFSRLLEDAALANFNCVRALGHFPGSFYDLCDELGIMVWQDLAIDGWEGGLTEDLAESVRAGVRDWAARLQSHPCIVLWCGNDGLELAASQAAPRRRADYIRLFEFIVPIELRKHAPGAPYWPSSPSSGGGFDEPESLDRGDAHPKCSDMGPPGRYASSFGTPSCPCLPTIEGFTLPEERNLFSRAMEEHSEGRRGTAHIMSNIHRYYLCPASFETALYASQLAQAEILRRAAQHYRRHRGRCMGALFRRLNDTCPGISCSSIDHTGRWKALHYFAGRFFAPVLLSWEEPWGVEKSLSFCVVNETRSPRAVLVRWELRDRLSRVKREETISLTVPALESAWLDRVELPEADIYEDFVSFTLYEMGARVSFGTALFAQPKYYRFLDPELSCRLEGDEVIVSAKAYARGVEIRNAREDMVLSDNYFDMLPGERRVKVLRGRPEGLKLRSVFDIK